MVFSCRIRTSSLGEGAFVLARRQHHRWEGVVSFDAALPSVGVSYNNRQESGRKISAPANIAMPPAYGSQSIWSGAAMPRL